MSGESILMGFSTYVRFQLMGQGFHIIFWSKPPKSEAYKFNFPGIFKAHFKLFYINNNV